MRPPKCSTIWRLIGGSRPVPWAYCIAATLAEFSNTSLLLKRNARAVVLYPRCALRRRYGQRHGTRSPAGTNLAGQQQVDQHRSSRSRSAQRGHALGLLHAHARAALAGGLRRWSAPRADHSRRSIGPCAHCAWPDLIFAVQHLADEPARRRPRPPPQAEKSLALLAPSIVAHQFGVGADRGQWRSSCVTEDMNRPEPVQAFELAVQRAAPARPVEHAQGCRRLRSASSSTTEAITARAEALPIAPASCRLRRRTSADWARGLGIGDARRFARQQAQRRLGAGARVSRELFPARRAPGGHARTLARRRCALQSRRRTALPGWSFARRGRLASDTPRRPRGWRAGLHSSGVREAVQPG